MCRVIATYPTANKARITATAMNAAGMPVSPVVAYAVGMTPAATVSGATPARTKNSTAGTPSRSRASARDTLPAWSLRACAARTSGLLGGSDARQGQARCDSRALSTAAWVWAISSRSPGSSWLSAVLQVAAGLRRAARQQPRAQPARDGQPGQGRALGGRRPGRRAQRGLRPGDRGERAVRVDRHPALAAARAPERGPGQVAGPLQPARHVAGRRCGPGTPASPAPACCGSAEQHAAAPAALTRPRAGCGRRWRSRPSSTSMLAG